MIDRGICSLLLDLVRFLIRMVVALGIITVVIMMLSGLDTRVLMAIEEISTT